MKERRLRNKPSYDATAKAWRDKHAGEVRAMKKRSQDKLREEMFDHFGHQCACCGESAKAFLTLEHTFRNGADERKSKCTYRILLAKLRRLGWPKNGYAILCMNCNWATRFGDTCPHGNYKPLA